MTVGPPSHLWSPQIHILKLYSFIHDYQHINVWLLVAGLCDTTLFSWDVIVGSWNSLVQYSCSSVSIKARFQTPLQAPRPCSPLFKKMTVYVRSTAHSPVCFRSSLGTLIPIIIGIIGIIIIIKVA